MPPPGKKVFEWQMAIALEPKWLEPKWLRKRKKGTAEGLGVVSGFADMGEKKLLQVGLDSSAARGIVRRIGLGKLTHC